MRDFRRLRRFGVGGVSGEEKPIMPVKEGHQGMIFCVTISTTPCVLLEAHLAVGHGKRNKMLAGVPFVFNQLNKLKFTSDNVLVICLVFQEPAATLTASRKKYFRLV